MTVPKPAQPCELPFDHESHRFKVTANPDGNGYELALWRDGAPVVGVGSVSWDDIGDATKSGVHTDLVGGAMATIRDAVTTKNADNPEPSKSDNGN